MKPTKKNKKLALSLLLLLAISFIITQTPIGSLLSGSPWWVYVVLAGIVLSGMLAIRYTLEDRRIEKEWIETEGNIYMKRIQDEKERKNMERS
ncbi:hypothetical protein GN156_12080 [bacterium LRH843]|nr:hypothetical protein [bacterium LRH843]